MWPNLLDLAINYAVLTPTAVLYWYSTQLLLDHWVGDSTVQLVVGFLVAVAIYFLHDVFRNNAPTRSQVARTAYETAYDYVVKLSCICYHHGCLYIYDALLRTGYLRPVYVAIIAAFVLLCLGGYRNVLGLPLLIETDDSVERYHPLSTLTFHSSKQLMVGSIWVYNDWLLLLCPDTDVILWEFVGELVSLRVGLAVKIYTFLFLGWDFLFTSSDLFAVGCYKRSKSFDLKSEMVNK